MRKREREDVLHNFGEKEVYLESTLIEIPASVDSKPLTQSLSPLDTTLTENQGGCPQPELGSPWQRPKLKRHKHWPSPFLKPSEIHSILPCRGFPEGVPHKLGALTFRHRGRSPQVASN